MPKTDEQEVPETPETPETPEAPEEPDPDAVVLTKAEAAALRRQAREGREAIKAQQKAEEERQRQEGEWQKLAETKEREAEEAKAAAQALEERIRVSTIAARLDFQDPADVLHHLSAEERADDALAEAALKRIAEAKPYLLRQPEPVKPEIGQVLKDGKTVEPGQVEQLTGDQLASMTPEQIVQAQKDGRLEKVLGRA